MNSNDGLLAVINGRVIFKEMFAIIQISLPFFNTINGVVNV